jgi:hypothetical protein
VKLSPGLVLPPLGTVTQAGGIAADEIGAERRKEKRVLCISQICRRDAKTVCIGHTFDSTHVPRDLEPFGISPDT